MPNVTPEKLREMARYERDCAVVCVRRGNDVGRDWRLGKEAAFLAVADMLEAAARESAHLVIPHDPNYHCWGK